MEIKANEKPDCPLIGQDGNIFNLIGIASRTLRQHGQAEQAKEMTERIYASGSYSEALGIIGEYVNITSVNDVKEKTSVRQHLKNQEAVSSAPGSKNTKVKNQER